MTRNLLRLAGLAMVAAASAANAQTSPATPAPDASTTTPNAITPPNGVARGVIRPNRPIDSGMVTKPPAHGHTMPVIKPPGTAR